MKKGTLIEPGASEPELAELEGRLGLPLCPSYRALFQASNGDVAHLPELSKRQVVLLATGATGHD